MLRRLLLLSILLVGSFEALADEPSQARIAELIQKLGSQSFRERENAQKELSQLPEDYLPLLQEAATKSSDSEVLERIRSIIRVQIERCFGLIQAFHTDGSVNAAFLESDGKTLISLGGNGTARFWEVSSAKLLREQKFSDQGTQAIRFSPSGKKMAFSPLSSSDPQIAVFEISTAKKLQDFSGPREGICQFNWSREERYLVGSGYDNKLRLWDTKTGKELLQLYSQVGARGVAVSAQGEEIVAGYENGEVHLLDAKTGKVIRKFSGHKRGVFVIALSPDEKTIATSDDNCIRLFNRESGKELENLAVPARVASMRFSPNGKRLLSGGSDNTLSLWNIETGKLLHRYEHHAGTISEVCFSAEGRQAISASVDGDVLLWKVPK
ncbi:WD40 repeat domain-containing protein [Telmatocola sphagniphila]|uniref:WD40 repeat domain-containing protein n=1 Tax=Telmatocola sphagniphila TaxID=1123043 RepID=A0A8E6B5U6_9BACT|nr:WD40 repeat domain-containing protein [Telmatocola sphagniphila]QVL32442.1 WD40 repeat domain-containing protein [Telmatocola sphagniphila]